MSCFICLLYNLCYLSKQTAMIWNNRAWYTQRFLNSKYIFTNNTLIPGNLQFLSCYMIHLSSSSFEVLLSNKQQLWWWWTILPFSLKLNTADYVCQRNTSKQLNILTRDHSVASAKAQSGFVKIISSLTHRTRGLSVGNTPETQDYGTEFITQCANKVYIVVNLLTVNHLIMPAAMVSDQNKTLLPALLHTYCLFD